VEERDRPGRLTQRKFEVESRPAPSPAPSELPTSPPPSPPEKPVRPLVPSNQALLERQLKWFRERARYESRRTEEGEPK